ncbi:MAG: error-prone DNA polymerase [Planctomycetota bacterium]
MPDTPHAKPREHPWTIAKRFQADNHAPARLVESATYAEIQCTSNFTFLHGGSHPEELVERAAALGYSGLAITDNHTFAGAVRAHVAAKALGVQLALGTRLMLQAGSTILRVLAYPTDRESYGRLCRLLTLGKRRAAKGECHLSLHDFFDHQCGLLAVIVPEDDPRRPISEEAIASYRGLIHAMDTSRVFVVASVRFDGHDTDRLRRGADLARHLGIGLVASNDVLYHDPMRRPLQDVLTCVREHRTLDTAGFLLQPNAERYLKTPDEMQRLFAAYPEAIANAVRLIEWVSAFSLDQLRYQYPHETCPPGKDAITHLRELTMKGSAERFPGPEGVPTEIKQRLEYELNLIAELNYPHYFLTVHDLVRFARSQNILCQGRGAAANSAVCYCLGVTSVDPSRVDLLFERFISRERKEPPDIDIDFEHERREEVIQYVYRKYGRDRAALTAEVISYRPRSAIREVGKALGLSLDAVDRLAKSIEWFDPQSITPGRVRELGFDPRDPVMGHLQRLTAQLLGFPRHLSQHVGGFVLTDRPLCESVPIENAAMPDRTIIEWDKDDIEAVGMLKVDCLGLGMLTAVRKSFELIERATAQKIELHTIPAEDPEVYDMLCEADAVGVFQVESRAQLSMLPRLRPRCYYDLVIEVAIVRPGPIVGDMVHPYLRRRHGEEPTVYPDEVVEEVLGRTLGVPLFQEQAMTLAIRCAGFTPDEADELRRAIAAWKRKTKVILEFGRKIVDGMVARGYAADFAQQCFERMKGFSEYGFPESHAASFAHIVYASAWLKRHHPAAFCAALINSQPMGFYQPAQLVQDAQRHGVKVRPVDVNRSAWDCTLEPDNDSTGRVAIRLGMRMVKGLRRDDADMIVECVSEYGAQIDPTRLWRRSRVAATAMRKLAEADAFGSMQLDRQQALWQTRQMRDTPLPLFDGLIPLTISPSQDTQPTGHPPLPRIAPVRQVVRDYETTGLSLKEHPLAFVRHRLERRGVTRCRDLADPGRFPHGERVSVAGLVLVRQRPGSASGVVFVTLEDETGVANLILWPKTFDRYRRVARHASILQATGTVQRDGHSGQVVHVLVRSLREVEHAENEIRNRSRDFH